MNSRKPSKNIREIYNDIARDYISKNSNLELSTKSLNTFRQMLEPGSHILDIGCGSGIFADWFDRNGFDVTGLDISDEMIRYVNEHYPRLKTIRGTLGDLPNQKYEGIWCSRVFHHISLSEQGNFLNLLTQHMTIDAQLYITTCIDDKTYEANDSENGALKTRMTIEDFKFLMSRYAFEVEDSNDWGNGMWEFFLKHIH